jgi:hypothetical protein
MTDTQVPLLDIPASEGDPNQLAELYADRLMDDLFNGVEQALEGDAKALSDLKTPLAEPPAPDIAVSTDGSLAATIDVASTLAGEIPTLTYALATDTAPSQPAQPKRRWLLIPLTFGAAGVAVATALLLGWLSQRQAVAPEAVVPAPTATVDAVATTPDTEFLEYLRRSLDVISQETGPAAGVPGGVPEVPVALSGSGLGLPPINGNALPTGATPAPNGLAQINVIERVYIPYQAGRPVAVAGAAVPAAPAPTAVPASSHVLVGILELGNRSAALLEIDGIPQRIYIGERIGNSGWSLVAVANGEATMRRNGEVRSIFIGQQF